MATKLTAALDLERKQAGTDLLSRLSGAISPSQEPEEQQHRLLVTAAAKGVLLRRGTSTIC